MLKPTCRCHDGGDEATVVDGPPRTGLEASVATRAADTDRGRAALSTLQDNLLHQAADATGTREDPALRPVAAGLG
ncbi:hypothetical protein ABT030_46970 [Streptomyces mirabilis]|uniref:hypothetical protein n=1 Tax=Streptomyces mirabilis TaxID=68239 RepID=UPI0033202BAA